MTFKEWMTLSEIGHVSLPREITLPMPDEQGNRMMVRVAMCDPMFERYHPVGHRRDNNGEIVVHKWQDMVNMNPKTGIGWEGVVPFTPNLYLGCQPRDRNAVVGPSRNLIMLPDDWFEHAMFIDGEGEVSYFPSEGIFGKTKVSRLQVI